MAQILGWDTDKRLSDFTAIADGLEAEGQTSRANAVHYLIQRAQAAEQALADNKINISLRSAKTALAVLSQPNGGLTVKADAAREITEAILAARNRKGN